MNIPIAIKCYRGHVVFNIKQLWIDSGGESFEAKVFCGSCKQEFTAKIPIKSIIDAYKKDSPENKTVKN